MQLFLNIRLEIALLRMHGVHCVSFVMENSCLSQLEFRACSNNINVRHAWCALSVFLHDGKFLVKAGGILSLRNYSWSIGFHIVVLGTHGVLRLFYFVMENACLRQLEF